MTADTRSAISQKTTRWTTHTSAFIMFIEEYRIANSAAKSAKPISLPSHLLVPDNFFMNVKFAALNETYTAPSITAAPSEPIIAYHIPRPFPPA